MQFALAPVLRLWNTSGTNAEVMKKPGTAKISPAAAPPHFSHFARSRASSSFPPPSAPPTKTYDTVHKPPNSKKKIFAIVHPADIPATTSAPPLLLYIAIINVSETIHDISDANIIADLPKISIINFLWIRNNLLIFAKNGASETAA